MTLLDASGAAPAQAGQRAEKVGVRIETIRADAVGWQPAGAAYDLVIVANLHPGTGALVLTAAAGALFVGGHLFAVGHDLADLGRHGPPDPERLLSIGRLSRALPAAVSVGKLELRTRRAGRPAGPDVDDADDADIAVFARAIKRAA